MLYFYFYMYFNIDPELLKSLRFRSLKPIISNPPLPTSFSVTIILNNWDDVCHWLRAGQILNFMLIYYIYIYFTCTMFIADVEHKTVKRFTKKIWFERKYY